MNLGISLNISVGRVHRAHFLVWVESKDIDDHVYCFDMKKDCFASAVTLPSARNDHQDSYRHCD